MRYCFQSSPCCRGTSEEYRSLEPTRRASEAPPASMPPRCEAAARCSRQRSNRPARLGKRFAAGVSDTPAFDPPAELGAGVGVAKPAVPKAGASPEGAVVRAAGVLSVDAALGLLALTRAARDAIL